MRRTITTLALALALCLALSGAALAHTPLCNCYAPGDGTVVCEGGFSDGSSAAGTAMKVLGAGGAPILEGQMDAHGEFVFDKPEGDYTVIFDAGEGHVISIPSSNIF